MTPASGSTLLAPGPGYDQAAESYDDWQWQPFWTHNESPLVESLVRLSSTPHVALDLGVGTGRYLTLLRDIGARDSIGVDISGGMLAVARRKIDWAPLVQADIRQLPFAANRVDLAIATRSLCHMAELDVAFGEIGRILRPGGVLVVTELDAEHAFTTTKVPARTGDISIATWKRGAPEIISRASNAGLSLTHFTRIRANDCRWLPPPPGLSSIDRASVRPIFVVCAFNKQ